VLVVDRGAMRLVPGTTVPSLFSRGDVIVINDAATLPAAFAATTSRGEDLEVRLVALLDEGQHWTVALLGRGDYRTRTEDRPAPPRLCEGDRIQLPCAIVATVTRVHVESTRLVDVELSLTNAEAPSLASIWSALYRAGRPVQYAHVPEPLALWDVQNAYGGRPWAVEMPSAGRVLRVETLLELGKRGIEIARVTHAAGLSSIGDATLDALLPLPERYEVPREAWEAIARARARGGRVIAIGTSVVRALEAAARNVSETGGITDLRIGPGTARLVVDAVLTGVHEVDTSHFTLLGAFAGRDVLTSALATAEREGLLGHELGDTWLVWGSGAARSDEERASRTWQS
jgi:S-adenosylmethionine:tRNA ribosyltransferase-isomerase